MERRARVARRRAASGPQRRHAGDRPRQRRPQRPDRRPQPARRRSRAGDRPRRRVGLPLRRAGSQHRRAPRRQRGTRIRVRHARIRLGRQRPPGRLPRRQRLLAAARKRPGPGTGRPLQGLGAADPERRGTGDRSRTGHAAAAQPGRVVRGPRPQAAGAEGARSETAMSTKRASTSRSPRTASATPARTGSRPNTPSSRPGRCARSSPATPPSANPTRCCSAAQGRTAPERARNQNLESGLFCALNAGQTTVTISSGGLSASLVVTVQEGSVRRPCGTVEADKAAGEPPPSHPRPRLSPPRPKPSDRRARPRPFRCRRCRRRNRRRPPRRRRCRSRSRPPRSPDPAVPAASDPDAGASLAAERDLGRHLARGEIAEHEEESEEAPESVSNKAVAYRSSEHRARTPPTSSGSSPWPRSPEPRLAAVAGGARARCDWPKSAGPPGAGTARGAGAAGELGATDLVPPVAPAGSQRLHILITGRFTTSQQVGVPRRSESLPWARARGGTPA